MLQQADAQQRIEGELRALKSASIDFLRKQWRSTFRSDPPPAFGPDLLRRSLAQHIQEKAFGGLPEAARRELDRAIRLLERNRTGRIELPRRIKAGAVLIKTWKDKSHHVTVLDHGFSYEGKTYVSLSQIARNITGTRWNGPKFFGLRVKSPVSAANSVSPVIGEVPRRGRPPSARSNLFNTGMEVGHGL